MVLPEKTNKDLLRLTLVCLTSSFFFQAAAGAQNGLPLPGNSSTQYVAPGGLQPSGVAVPGSTVSGGGGAVPSRYSAPVPGAPVGGVGPAPGILSSTYDRLPLNAGNAVARLEELRNLMPHSRPKDFQDSIGEFCDWLSDMADAHWKLSQSFAKSDSTKTQADSEKQLCYRFGQLKRQAMLLKAEFLISQKRFPEALSPLVDIVVAEPKTETGQSAYRLLKEIGFSEDGAVREAAR